ncbi:hypothetical protein U1Q18_006730, partial [Sarracenia purpurea var. burkii]
CCEMKYRRYRWFGAVRSLHEGFCVQETRTGKLKSLVNKSLRILHGKKFVKEVVSIQSKGGEHYMAAEFEPSKELQLFKLQEALITLSLGLSLHWMP